MSCIAAAAIGAASNTPIWAKIAAIGTVATAAIALFALIGAVAQLKQTNRSTVQTRAQSYLQRFDDPELIPFVEKAHFVVGPKQHMSVDERRARNEWWDNLPFKDQFEVDVALNFWEQMAGMYNRKLVDQKLIDEYFGDAALEFWERSQWLVLHMRAQNPGLHLYNEWDDMREDILLRREGRRRRVSRRMSRRPIWWRRTDRNDPLARLLRLETLIETLVLDQKNSDGQVQAARSGPGARD